MTLLTLQYFIAAAEYSSFSVAAESLFISQPTLSRRIAELEDELGVMLFVRRSHSVELTKAGRRLYPEAKKILESVSSLKSIVTGEIEYTPLNIGYTDVFNNPLLTQIAQSVTRAYKGAKINVIRLSLKELMEQFNNGSVDMIIISESFVSFSTGVAYMKISDNPLKMVLPQNHPLAGKNSISPKEIEQETIITYSHEANPHAAATQKKVLEKLGFLGNIKPVAIDSTNIQILVGAGQGIAFLTEENRKQNIPGVSYHDIEDFEWNEKVVLCYKTDNKNPLLTTVLSEFRKAKKSNL